MPLKSGVSPKTVSKNIDEMVDAGHPQKQAVAASLNEARESAKKEGKKSLPDWLKQPRRERKSGG